MKKLIIAALITTSLSTSAFAGDSEDFVMGPEAAAGFADLITNHTAEFIDGYEPFSIDEKIKLLNRLPAFYECVAKFAEGKVYSTTKWKSSILLSNTHAECAGTVYY